LDVINSSQNRRCFLRFPSSESRQVRAHLSLRVGVSCSMWGPPPPESSHLPRPRERRPVLHDAPYATPPRSPSSRHALPLPILVFLVPLRTTFQSISVSSRRLDSHHRGIPFRWWRVDSSSSLILFVGSSPMKKSPPTISMAPRDFFRTVSRRFPHFCECHLT